jgi:hypothetical protein
MSEDSDTDKLLRQIYYSETGFQGITDTYKEAKKLIPSITTKQVKTYLDKQQLRQLKPYRSFNSFVADHPLEEVAGDIADFTKSAEENNGFRYALVAVDVFTKYCHVQPMKGKTADDCVQAMKEIINRIGVFKTWISDREGGFESPSFIKLLNSQNIKHIITSSPSGFAERMVKTIKDMIMIRIQGLKLKDEEWVKLLPTVLKQYNSTKHSTTGVSPIDGTKPENRIQVWLNITKKARFNRVYPPLFVGTLVRIYLKKRACPKGMTHDFRKKYTT